MVRAVRLSTVLLASCALLTVLSLIAVYGGVLVRIATSAHGATGDFLSFYSAGYLVRTGQVGDLYDPTVIEQTQRMLFPGMFDEAIGYPLPVFVAFLFVSLSLLPFTAAFLLYMGAMALLCIGLLYLANRCLHDLPELPRTVFLIAAGVSMPAVAAIVFGQVDLIALAGLSCCYLLLRADRPATAGVALVLALVKPHLAVGVLLLLAFRRDWRALAGFAVVGLPLLTLPALLTAPDALVDNVRILSSYPGADKELAVNATVMPNWRGFVTSATNSNTALLWTPGFAAIAAAALVGAVRAWRHAGLDQSFAVAVALPLLLSPHVHTQNLVLLLLPASIVLRAYLAQDGSEGRQLRAIDALLLGYVLAFALPIGAILGLSLTFFPIALGYIALLTRWPRVTAARTVEDETSAPALVAA
jgi:hypothetical protein